MLVVIVQLFVWVMVDLLDGGVDDCIDGGGSGCCDYCYGLFGQLVVVCGGVIMGNDGRYLVFCKNY